MNPPAVPLDHLFILCAVGAPEADALTRLGFLEGANTHPGQGTACRRFFFRDAYLELAWVHDPDEAQSVASRGLGLWERWSGRQSGACPFGVVLPATKGADGHAAPFRTWAYRPSYLPPGVSIGVASETSLDEPAFFWMASPRGEGRHAGEPTALQTGQTITGVRIGTPVADDQRCEAARIAEVTGLLAFDSSDAHLLALTLDGGRAGEVADLRDALPLLLRGMSGCSRRSPVRSPVDAGRVPAAPRDASIAATTSSLASGLQAIVPAAPRHSAQNARCDRSARSIT